MESTCVITDASFARNNFQAHVAAFDPKRPFAPVPLVGAYQLAINESCPNSSGGALAESFWYSGKPTLDRFRRFIGGNALLDYADTAPIMAVPWGREFNVAAAPLYLV